jgi:putative endonuclease
MHFKNFAAYILANDRNSVLYTGVTNDLARRIAEHKAKIIPGFTKRYNVEKLVYFELFEDATNAIAREKQIKAGSRKKKELLIEKSNPGWEDLYPQILA